MHPSLWNFIRYARFLKTSQSSRHKNHVRFSNNSYVAIDANPEMATAWQIRRRFRREARWEKKTLNPVLLNRGPVGNDQGKPDTC